MTALVTAKDDAPLADLKDSLERRDRCDLSALKGKSVLVTGGASGLGAAIVARFLELGASVTIVDLNKERGQEMVNRLGAQEAKVSFVPTDVTSWESQVSAFKSAIHFSAHQSVDIVVAAAGVAGTPFIYDEEVPASPTRDPPKPSTMDTVFDVDAKGVYMTAKLAQHYFSLNPKATKKPSTSFRETVILIGSLCGYLELNSADYTAAKWAVRGLFRSIRSKMEDMGYRTNLVAPWVMDTPMSHGIAEVFRAEGIPIGRIEDVAEAVVRCAADDTICGRAFGIGAEKTFDLEDDLEGLNSGRVMADYLLGEAKGLMAFQGQRP